MKSSLIRPALALVLAASLAACGGSDKAEFTVAGSVTDLVYDGLVLSNAGVALKVAPPTTAGAAVRFAFPDKLEYGDTYAVTVTGNPAHQTCEPGVPPGGLYANNADTAGRLVTIDIAIACKINEYTVGGTITGLTGAGLVLANGSTGGTYTAATPATPPATTPITYALPLVKFGTTYGVTVTKQPAGQVCTVVNPTGTMGDAAVTNVNVTCVAA
jgi:hypothetical protein